MVARAQVGTLRDDRVRADAHGHEVVDPGPLADPDVVPHFEMPWVLDMDIGLDQDTPPHSGAEPAEHPTLQAVRRHDWIEHDERLDNEPERPEWVRSPGSVPTPEVFDRSTVMLALAPSLRPIHGIDAWRYVHGTGARLSIV